MRKNVYWKLAWQSLWKNYRITLPFIGASILMTMMFCSIRSLAIDTAGTDFFGSSSMNILFEFGTWVMLLFSCIFFFYLNSVLLKNRKKENGLYTVLGLEKHHLIRMIFYQFAVEYAITIVLGIPLGILLEKVMSLLIARLMHMEPVFGFSIHWQAILFCIVWIGAFYLMIFAYSAFVTLKSNPLDLLKSEQQAQRPVKSRWITTILGLAFLLGGYGLALSITDPVGSVALFPIAAGLVIIGTYLLFLTGTGTLFNALHKNKSFYYKPNHFISLSLMQHRLKTNAASLANIALLSTMVLVALSSSLTLMISVQNIGDQIYPREKSVLLSLNSEGPLNFAENEQTVLQAAKEAGMDVKNEASLPPYGMIFLEEDNLPCMAFEAASLGQALGVPIDVQPGTLMAIDHSVPEGSLYNINGTAYTVSGNVDVPEEAVFKGQLLQSRALVTDSFDALYQPGVHEGFINQVIVFDAGNNTTRVNGEDPRNQKMAALLAGTDTMDPYTAHVLFTESEEEEGASFTINDRDAYMHRMYQLYGGLLFIGIYLSMLFILIVVLIMYYKQLSEGFEDKNRFRILMNVGLEEKQIKKIINDQVLTMFFLPLGTAAVHICFAFPMLSRIFYALSVTDWKLALIVMAATFALFALIYVIIYRLTARTYYKITCQS